MVIGLVLCIGLGVWLHDATSSPSSSVVSSSKTATKTDSTGTNVSTTATKVDAAVVDITTTLEGGGEAAGTGMVISSSGLVLTNNHVIADATSIEVDIGGTGNTHTAKVVGYDVADDVAVIKIQGVSGLQTIERASSTELSVGDEIVAIGNALGQGGTPAAASGTVTALDQTITASDDDGTGSETLHDLIQINAAIQPGDSGGPLVDGNGRVVGMDTAAAVGSGRFGFTSETSTVGYAIPIERAMTIAEQIISGDGGTDIHLGSSRAVLGVDISSTAGVVVQGVQSGSAADSAGIQTGDTITAIDGHTVSSASDLTDALARYSPKDQVRVDWTDTTGVAHHATVELGSGAPA
jgi:S1-C subfamily serine protease